MTRQQYIVSPTNSVDIWERETGEIVYFGRENPNVDFSHKFAKNTAKILANKYSEAGKVI